MGCLAALLYDARISLFTALLAGFGRAAAEVGGDADGIDRVPEMLAVQVVVSTGAADFMAEAPRQCGDVRSDESGGSGQKDGHINGLG